MRTKFIYLITLVAAFISFSGLTSCKDTSEDDYNQLKVELSDDSSAIKLLQEQVKALQTQQQSLETAVASINSILDNNTWVTKKQLDDAIADINAALKKIKECNCDTAATNAAIRDLYNQLKNIDPSGSVGQATIENIVNNYLNGSSSGSGQTVINNIISEYLENNGYSAGDSCKCDFSAYATKVYVDSEIEAAKKLLQDQIDAIKVCNKKCEAFFNVDGIALDSVLKLIQEAKQVGVDAQKAAEAAQTTANEALGLAQRDSIRIDAVDASIVTINNTLGTMQTKLDETYEKAVAAYELAKADSLTLVYYNTRIDSLATLLTSLGYKVDSMGGVLNDVVVELPKIKQSIADSIAAVRKEIAAALDEAKAYTDQEVAALLAHIQEHCNQIMGLQNGLDAANAKIDANALKISDLQNAYNQLKEDYQKADSELAAKIAALDTRVDGLEDRLDKAEEDIAQAKADILGLKEEIEKLRNSLANLVTGVVIEGTYNPAFGGFDTPFGIKSNFLVAYYGQFQGNSKGAELLFPTNKKSNYLHQQDALTAADMEMLGITPEVLAEAKGDVLVSDKEGNAGTLYLTINPTSVDFDGKVTPVLANTLGKVNGMTLSTVKTSNKKKMFGYTRAAGAGFYEASATVKAENLPQVPNMDLNADGLKETLQDLLKTAKSVQISTNGISYSEPINLGQIATNLYDAVNDILEADGVQVEYTDENGISRTVTSEHNLAATAVAPFSYKFASTLHWDEMPGYNQALSLIKRVNKTINKVVDDIDFHITVDLSGITDIDSIKIKQIELTPISFSLDTLSYSLGDNFVKTVTSRVEEITPEGDTIPWKYTYTPNLDGIINTDSLEFIIPVSHDSIGKDDGIHYIAQHDTTIVVALSIEVNTDAVGSVTIDGGKLQVSFTADYREQVIDLIKEVNNLMGNMEGNLDQVNSFIDDVNEYLQDVNDAMDSVNGILGKVRSLGDQIQDALNGINDKVEDALGQVSDMVDRFTNALTRILDAINSKVCGLVNGINDKLQPVLVGETTSGNGVILSGLKSAPTPVNSTFSVLPTSYSAELIAPAFKKFVAVTNVFKGSESAQKGNAACKSALLAANNGNSQLNVVLDGSVRGFDIKGLQKGYVYEIVYTAVDFSGVIVADKYYVTVK